MDEGTGTTTANAGPTQPMQHGHRPAAASAGAGDARAGARLALPPPLLPGRPRGPGGARPRGPPTRPRGGPPGIDFAANEGVAQGQCFATLGHKSDFGLMLAGPDLRAIHGVQMAIQSSALGPALVPCYSFYSITEVSEYVPTPSSTGPSSATARGWTRSGGLQGEGQRLREPARADEPAAADPGVPGLALLLLLPDEQDAAGRAELVPAALRGPLADDGRARPERHEVRRQGHAGDHRVDRPGRLGVGRDPLGAGTPPT